MGNFSKLGQAGRKAGEEMAEEPSLWTRLMDRWGAKHPEEEIAKIKAEGGTVTPEAVQQRLEQRFNQPTELPDFDIEKALDKPAAPKAPKAKAEAPAAPAASRKVEKPEVDVEQSKFITELHKDPAKKEQHIKQYLEELDAAAKRGEEPAPNLWFKSAEAASTARPRTSGRAALPKTEVLVDTDSFAGVQRPIYGLPPSQEVKLLGPANQVVTVPLGEALSSGKYRDYKLTDIPGQEFDLVGPVAVPRGRVQQAKPVEQKLLPAPAKPQYDEPIGPAKQQYDEPIGPAKQQYDGPIGPTKQQYDEPIGPAQQKDDGFIGPQKEVPEPAASQGWRKYAGKALLGGTVATSVGALLLLDGEPPKSGVVEPPRGGTAAPAQPASDPEQARGSSLIQASLTAPKQRGVAEVKDLETYEALGEFTKARADYASSLRDIQAEYRLEKDKLRKQELAEKLINGIGMLMAGWYGQKHGIDMSGTQFDKTDWAEKYRAAREDMMADVSLSKSQFEARKEQIEAARQDAGARNQARLLKAQQEQKVFDAVYDEWKDRNSVEVQQASLAIKQQTADNQRDYYEYLLRTGVAKNQAEAKKVLTAQQAQAQKFVKHIRDAAKAKSSADRKAAKAQAALINSQFEQQYGYYLYEPSALEANSPGDIAEELMSAGAN